MLITWSHTHTHIRTHTSRHAHTHSHEHTHTHVYTGTYTHAQSVRAVVCTCMALLTSSLSRRHPADAPFLLHRVRVRRVKSAPKWNGEQQWGKEDRTVEIREREE